jgi:hypothetical protein
MVTDDNAITADLNTLLGIGYTLDALDSEGLATAHLLPCLNEPGHLLPTVGSSMPDIVNPLGTCLVRFLLGVNAVFGKPFLEDWIRQAQISTNAVVESIVAVRDIIVSPSKLPCAVKTLLTAASDGKSWRSYILDSQDTGSEARVNGSAQQRNRQLIIVRHVQLEEARALSVSSTDILNGLRASSTQTIWQVKFFGDLCYRELSKRVVDLVDTDGRESNRCASLVTPDFPSRVALVGVDQHARDDAMAVESLTVGQMCCRVASIGGGIVPATLRKLLLCSFLELVRV